MPEKSNIRVVLYHLEGCPPCRRFIEGEGGESEWCKLKKILDKVGIKHEQYEASEPEVPDDIDGFPTIRIYKTSEDSIDYEGDRTAKDILTFIKDIQSGKIQIIKEVSKKGSKEGSKESDSESLDEFKQCGGGNREEYYKMKYFKYKAKYIYLRSTLEN